MGSAGCIGDNDGSDGSDGSGEICAIHNVHQPCNIGIPGICFPEHSHHLVGHID